MATGFGGDVIRVEKRYVFFDVVCEVYTTPYVYPAYPWLFRIQRPGGAWVYFAGIPNKCATVRSAMMRAWHRCKWMAAGIFDSRYVH